MAIRKSHEERNIPAISYQFLPVEKESVLFVLLD